MVEQRYRAVLAVIGEGLTVTEVAVKESRVSWRAGSPESGRSWGLNLDHRSATGSAAPKSEMMVSLGLYQVTPRRRDLCCFRNAWRASFCARIRH